MKGGGDAPIAQLVERYTCNVKVSCSIHGGSLANVWGISSNGRAHA